MKKALLALLALIVVAGGAAPTGATAAGAPPHDAGHGSAGFEDPPTPDLIEADERAGAIDEDEAAKYTALALAEPAELPARYRSPTPWDGTLPLLELKRALPAMPPGPERDAVERAVGKSGDPDDGTCSGSSSTLPTSLVTDHFVIGYDPATLVGLTIDDYAASLEHSWVVQVDEFGWAAPPLGSTPAPEGRYHVRIQPLGAGLYGYVSSVGSYAGHVGDNPNTPWHDADAYASCMVLNADYTQFVSGAQAALDSTTSHELNHSIQFGYGALTGANAPDSVFVEGGAMWMEDEVHDHADDNHYFLWPDFTESMGAYSGSPYAYWITFRGMLEQFGTGIAGGGEQVMQDFWELTSQNSASNLQAMDQALVTRGTTLADAFHAYAIAARSLKTCDVQFFLPHCFEEAADYVSIAGPTAVHDTIAGVGGSVTGSVKDDYALRWIGLPVGATYPVRLQNTSSGGLLRGTVSCETAEGLQLHPLPTAVAAGQATTLLAFDATQCLSATAVITNEARTSANPTSSTARSFELRTSTVTPSLRLLDLGVLEGAAGVTTPAQVRARLSEAADHNVTVGYKTVNGTAKSGSDYHGVNTSKVIPAGTTEVFLTVNVIGDDVVEPNEKFKVAVTGVTGATVADGVSYVTIVADEEAEPAPDGPALYVDDGAVMEGTGANGTYDVRVRLSEAAPHTVTVKYKTANSTGKSGSDYWGKSGTLTIPAGNTTAFIPITIIGDSIDEPNEKFKVVLSSPWGATVADGVAYITIVDDDPSPGRIERR